MDKWTDIRIAHGLALVVLPPQGRRRRVAIVALRRDYLNVSIG